MEKVKVYSTQTCPWCQKTKEFLKENNIEFEDYDISADQEKAKEMIEKSGQRGVPVIDIEGNVLIGFNEERMKELLQL